MESGLCVGLIPAGKREKKMSRVLFKLLNQAIAWIQTDYSHGEF